ncbi:MAG: protein-export chaperone SecB [Pseudomonadota bacterium]
MTDDTATAAAAGETAQPQRTVALRKIYVKDMSFESPMAPQIFTASELKPTSNLNLRSTHRKLEDQPIYEMVLTLTLDSKVGDDTVFLVELHQAGLFQIEGFNDAEAAQILGTFCPTTLFPYAREVISSAVLRGGFPEFLLQPIDFDGLWARSQAEQAAAAQQAAGDTH